MAEQWLATLSEVRRQAARVAAAAGVQPPDSDGTWCAVSSSELQCRTALTARGGGSCRHACPRHATATSPGHDVQRRVLRRYDVAEGTIETSDLETVDESGAWRGLQWLNAFEILVCSCSRNPVW